jgi:hypothetical protein
MSNRLFDVYGNQQQPLVVRNDANINLSRIEALLEAIARKLKADMKPFDICECGHERREHSKDMCHYDGCWGTDDKRTYEHKFKKAE